MYRVLLAVKVSTPLVAEILTHVQACSMYSIGVSNVVSPDKYLLLFSLMVLVLGLLVLVKRWPQSRYKTFSQHAAVQKLTIYYYICLFVVVLPPLYLFFSDWLIPKYTLPSYVLVAVAVSSVSQVACTLVPEVGGRKTQTHQSLAGLSALALLPVMFALFTAPTISAFSKVITAICSIVMVSILLGLVFLRKKTLPGMFLQIGYFTAFFLPLLVLTY